ncbi:MAG TPA: hypothetical protein VGP94_16750 [Tepidisphaeraceae bacterium]|jgi:hypothetical protein|nr:hypothetical protein [Tepidisphaeraceae bacterium]
MSTVDQTAAPTMQYGQSAPMPWPIILRFIAILTLLYGAATIGEGASIAMMIWPPRRTPRIPATSGQYWLWSIALALEVAIGAMLIWGAAKLLRGASHRPMLIGFWILIALWPIGTVLSLILQPALGSFNLLRYSLLDGTERNLFPFVVILLLRAYPSR